MESGSHNRVSTHYVIDQKGNAEKLFDDKYWGGNAGDAYKGYLSKNSLAIEIQAVGSLYDYDESKGRWRSKAMKGGWWPIKYGGFGARPVDDNYNVIQYKGYDWYEGYSNSAINATERVVTNWMSKQSIPYDYKYKRLFPNK